MLNKTTIRYATADDIAIIQEIAYQTWPKTYGRIISQEQIEFMLEKMYNSSVLLNELYSGIYFLLAETEEESVGFASFGFLGNNEYKLHKLYINPTNQKSGAGKQLLAEVSKKVVSLGGKALYLQVNRANKAVGFYQKMGFEIVEEKDFDMGSGFYMNDYVMRLSL
ncbi:MAG: GNAT family N-acetyltransferase [Chitinophagaceae bacterium]